MRHAPAPARLVLEALDVEDQDVGEAVQAEVLGCGGAVLAGLAVEGLLPLHATAGGAASRGRWHRGGVMPKHTERT